MDNPMYFAEPFTRVQAWIDLILLANHKPGYIYVRGNKVAIKRGQTAISETGLAQRWQWSRGKVRRFLAELEKEQQIVQQKSRIKSLISIVNYDRYQSDGQQTIQQTIQQTDTNNNDNNNINNNTHECDNDEFEKFWNLYDKKIDRKKCFAKWQRLSKKDKQKIFETLPAYIAATPDKKYRKNPLTYLNGEVWKDEDAATVKSIKPKYTQYYVNINEYVKHQL